MNCLREYCAGELYAKYARSEMEQGEECPLHMHDDCEIYYFVSGRVEYLVEGTTYVLRPGDLLLMRPAEFHRPKILAGSTYERYNVNFPTSLLESIDPDGHLLRPFFERPLGRGNLYTAAETGGLPTESLFAAIFDAGADAYEQRLAFLTGVLAMLSAVYATYRRPHREADAPVHSRTEEMAAYISDHLGEALSVDSLAERFFLSPSQFARVFKEATGASPWAYITAKRLTLARERIRGGAAVQDVFEGSGFGDYSAFYRAYKKRFGTSPTEDA